MIEETQVPGHRFGQQFVGGCGQNDSSTLLTRLLNGADYFRPIG